MKILVFVLLLLAGCDSFRSLPPGHPQPSTPSSEPAAVTALLNAGYRDIQLLGHVDMLFFSPCSSEDSVFTSYDFQARNAEGVIVRGHVCCGLVWRACTIRF